MADSENTSNLIIEHPLLKVPYEVLSQAFKNSSKLLERDTNFVTRGVNDLASKSARGKLTAEEGIQELDNLVTRLKSLKRKLDASKEAEEVNISRLRARLNHLSAVYDEKDPAALYRWKHTRLDRILIDYLLREGHYDTAVTFSESQEIKELVDIDIFLHCRKVIDGLKERNCGPALEWCKTNRSRLKKLKSTFEFRLRLQEFLELAKERKLVEAITYSRKHLAPVAQATPECLPQVQAAMGALAFLKDTSCGKYRRLFDEARWEELIDDFKRENYALYSMSTRSLLDITMQSGLSAIKTPFCYQSEDQSPNCPVCVPTFGELAKDLPFSHHIRSSLVCRISGEVMNEDNPPMALPNGCVYSLNALTRMASLNNDVITCPRTGATCNFGELTKVFIS